MKVPVSCQPAIGLWNHAGLAEQLATPVTDLLAAEEVLDAIDLLLNVSIPRRRMSNE